MADLEIGLVFSLDLYYDFYGGRVMTLLLMIAAAFAVLYGATAIYFYYGYRKKMSL